MNKAIDIQTMLHKYRWCCEQCASYIKQRNCCGREYAPQDYEGLCVMTPEDVRGLQKKRDMGW